MGTYTKICFIVPYFGKLPKYFPFWLKSCQINESIDWLFITDQNIVNPPKNVRIIKRLFCDLKKDIQSKFNFDISLETPYKLCDFKPAYGYIFSEYIKDYTFWGHCDIDLIWGKIRDFVTEDLLYKYDRLFIHGHCVLYRHTPEIDIWFKTLPPIKENYTYIKIFSSKENWAFDEFGGKSSWGGINKMVELNNKKQYKNECFDDIYITQKNFLSGKVKNDFKDLFPIETIKKASIFFKFSSTGLLRYTYINKKLYEHKSMYVHLQKRNMTINTPESSSFIIVPNEFLSINTPFNIAIKKSKYTHFYIKPYIIRFHNLKKKIWKILSNL